MSARRNRVCTECGKIDYTASKSKICRLCAENEQLKKIIAKHKENIEKEGYLIIGDVFKDMDGHICFNMTTPCGHEYTSKIVNLNRLINNAKAKGIPLPCGTCGPKHRLTNALAAYIEKYGRDYDVKKWDDYRMLVRKLSDITYRQFKEEINPQNYRRGKKTWHLDHIFPIIECFKQGWSVEKAASKENLQMLYWQENLIKSGKV